VAEMNYVVDACALIAFLRKEEGADKLRNLMKDPGNSFYMHAINLCEVYYDTCRVSGENKAENLFEDIKQLPIQVIWGLDKNLVKLAGKYKSRYKISFADSFVLALAEKEKSIVISTDHHEFEPIAEKIGPEFYWLR
jgi:PIN domain nuclease of toxin-antitoxin system